MSRGGTREFREFESWAEEGGDNEGIVDGKRRGR